MFEPNVISAGQGNSDRISAYYTEDLHKEDYYLKGDEPPGIWAGEASSLGLRGEVFKQDMKAVLEGIHPQTGKYLVAAGGHNKNHRAGWDCPFSAPKDVSILFARAEGELRETIRKCHEDAVRETMNLVDARYSNSLVRRVEYVEKTDPDSGEKSKEKLTRNESPRGLIYSIFEHRSSREMDPQLHSHAIIYNLAQRHDGSWGGINIDELFENKVTIGATYRAELARNLMDKVGVEIEPRKNAFAIKGIEDSWRDSLSKRHFQIKSEAEKRGVSGDYRLEKNVALVTRASKKSVSDELLSKLWMESLKEMGFSSKKLSQTVGRELGKGRDFAEKYLDYFERTLAEITDKESTFTMVQFDKKFSEIAQIEMSGREIFASLDLARKSERILRVGMDYRGGEQFTTQEMIRIESKILDSLASLRAEKGLFHLPEKKIDQYISRFEKNKGFSLLPSQREALVNVLHGRRLELIEGYAGSGKTTIMEVLRDISRVQRKTIIGVTPTHKAKEELVKSGIASFTIDRFLFDVAKGHRNLDKDTVIIADEMGMVGSKKYSDLLALASRSGASIVTVGDSMQTPPVEAGAPHRLVKNTISHSVLKDVVRQKSEAQRDAAILLREGRSHEAMKRYLDGGNVEFLDSKEAAIGAISRGYIADRDAGKSTIAIAMSNEEVAKLNEVIRAQLVSKGEVVNRGKIFDIVSSQGIQEQRSFAKGDQIIIRANDNRLGLTNGMHGRVVSVRGQEIKFEVEGGQKKITKMIPMDRFKAVDHGYARTANLSQGGTYDTAHLLPSLSYKLGQAYVVLTRQRENLTIYADYGSLEGFKFQKLERAVSHEERVEIKQRAILERLGEVFGKEQDKFNISDIERKVITGERLYQRVEIVKEGGKTRLAGALVDPEVKSFIDGLNVSTPRDQDFERALRRVYITPLAVDHKLHIPVNISALWQSQALKMLKERDFSGRAVMALKETIKDVPVGVRAVHNQKIADDIIGRRDELKPYTSLVHSAEKQLGALSLDGQGVISIVLIHPDAKALIESLDPKSAIDQAKVEAVAKIYELALGAREKYATPSNSLGSWQIMAFKMLSENDFSAEKIEALKKSIRNVDLGERPLETERLRSVMESRRSEVKAHKELALAAMDRGKGRD